jgi:hypothetical protein
MKRLVALIVVALALAIGVAPVSAGPPYHCNQMNVHPSGPLASGQVGVPYSAQVWVTPANAYLYYWTVTPSTPIPGVTAVASGNTVTFSGIPTTAGTYTFTVTGGPVYVPGTICPLANTYTVTVVP